MKKFTTWLFDSIKPFATLCLFLLAFIALSVSPSNRLLIIAVLTPAWIFLTHILSFQMIIKGRCIVFGGIFKRTSILIESIQSLEICHENRGFLAFYIFQKHKTIRIIGSLVGESKTRQIARDIAQMSGVTLKNKLEKAK